MAERYLEFKDETEYPGLTPRVLFSSQSVNIFKAKQNILSKIINLVASNLFQMSDYTYACNATG